MHIEVIDTFDRFDHVRQDWERVYDSDPEAQFFLSWNWMRRWLDLVKESWFVLAARTDGEASRCVGFFPLRRRNSLSKRGAICREITMAGNRLADYTGFICIPEYQDAAIAAFAIYIRTLDWMVVNLESIHVSAERLQKFLDRFPRTKFNLRQFEHINETDNVNVCICPRLYLPNDWDEYLNKALGANTRQKVRRFLRKIDDGNEFYITHANEQTIDNDLEVILQFWKQKWSSRKGESLHSIVKLLRIMLLHCFHNGSLFIPILWSGNTPLGALGILIDEKKRSLLFFIAGRDENVKIPPPGFVLHAYSIRYAIANGFATYDFLRGNEPYKYMFGAEDYRIKRIIVTAKNK
jgi:CelD/BcsL family acetyltransferase involved in cellulose biosynthesis